MYLTDSSTEEDFWQSWKKCISRRAPQRPLFRPKNQSRIGTTTKLRGEELVPPRHKLPFKSNELTAISDLFPSDPLLFNSTVKSILQSFILFFSNGKKITLKLVFFHKIILVWRNLFYYLKSNAIHSFIYILIWRS